MNLTDAQYSIVLVLLILTSALMVVVIQKARDRKAKSLQTTAFTDRPMVKVPTHDGKTVQLDFTFLVPDGYEFVLNHCTFDTAKRTVTPTDERAECGLRKKATP